MRVFVIKLFDLFVFVLLPFILVVRLIIFPVMRVAKIKPISIWSGAPIICMTKNCKAEQLLGFNSITLVRNAYYITDEFDFNLSQLSRGNRLPSLVLSYSSFLVCCLLTRQVHAYFDGGILPSRIRRHFSFVELFVYRFLGIHLFIWTYGADVRTRKATMALGQPNCCTDCKQINIACICDIDQGEDNYGRVYKTAAAVFSMGDMIEYTPGSRNDLFFWPIDLAAQSGKRYRPVYPTEDRNLPLRVVHAPNHRMFKGTRYLEVAVDELRNEGLDLELILVEKVPNSEAMELYRTADLIFDQCLIGFHGYFALEAMALGKPVMCFIRKPDEYLLFPEECPIINTHVATLKEDLRYLASRRSELAEIGLQGRLYIERHFSFDAFANRLDKVYRDLGVYP